VKSANKIGPSNQDLEFLVIPSQRPLAPRIWRNRWLFFIATCLLLPTAAFAADRPNILWISLEDISPDLGCYGDKYAISPNIDRLASEGCRYTNAFTHAGVCAPSRSGIITGMYPTSMGTHFMRCKGVPPPGVKCFPEYLRAAGYYCTNDSKTDYNFDCPVTAWDENRKGAHWRNRPSKATPFFCVINLTTTHESQVRLPERQLENRRQSLAESERHDPAQAPLPPYYPDTPVVRRDMANYYDNLTFTDKEVGRILKQLDDDGLRENTIVFFWGDHGRGLPRHKRWIYDSGIHVPLVVRWPGAIKAGSTSDELVAFVDLAPTVLSLAGVSVPAYMQGQAFLGESKARAPREYIYAARDRMDETLDIIRAVRDNRYKYIRNYRPDLPYAQHIAYMDEMPTMKEWRRLAQAGELAGPPAIFFQPTKPVEELYDTHTDPHEIKNLAADATYAPVLQRMRSAHEKWRETIGDLGLTPEADLNELRRPGGKWSVTSTPEVKYSAGNAVITCETEGASIAYRIGRKLPPGDAGKWSLYTGPVPIKNGDEIRIKACRLGYKDSPVVSQTLPE
jgi:N-sulfoglucosamine sulfohydrolase